MHFVEKDVSQDTKGYITVVVQDIKLITKRLAAVAEALEGTKFRCAQDHSAALWPHISISSLATVMVWAMHAPQRDMCMQE